MALALRYVINWSCICCCCSVTQLCMTLCNPMLCSILGFPVLHHLLEFSQTHLHWVGDAIQPSHPLSFPSPPAFNLSQLRAFSNESVLHIRWPKCWSFSFSISPSNELISFRIDWWDLLAVQGTLKSLLQHHSTKASILQHSEWGKKRLSSCPPTFLYFDHEFVKMHIMLMEWRALSGTKHKGDSILAILVSRK